VTDVIVERDVLTVATIAGWPGTVLRASPLLWMGALSPAYQHAVFERSAGSGAGWEPVRSGNPARIVDGAAHACDTEAAAGSTMAYRVSRAGEVLAQATITIPDDTPPVRSGLVSGWIKSIRRPGLSMPGTWGAPSEVTRGMQWQGSTSWRTGHETGQAGHPLGQAFALTVHLWSWAQLEQLRAIVDAGVVLWQPSARLNAGPGWYARVTSEAVQQTAAHAAYSVVLGLQQMPRPATWGAPLVIPGHTYRTARAQFSSPSAWSLSFPSTWDQILWGIGRADATA